MDYARRPLADALSAAYVAGTLRGPARRRFELLLQAHPALRAAVRGWEDRLLPLTVVLEPVAPSPALWPRIEQRLWPRAAAAPATPWWQHIAPWRALSGMATVATLALAVLLANPAPNPAPVVVVLQGTADAAAAGGGGFVASVSGDGRSLVTRPLLQVAVQPDRVLELWSVPPQGNPQSLGLIKADGVTVLDRRRLPATLLQGGTAALAVSVEPPGGSPTGVPTGPVVFAGKLQL
jgi:anti-sigma-K factor RskA